MSHNGYLRQKFSSFSSQNSLRAKAESRLSKIRESKPKNYTDDSLPPFPEYRNRPIDFFRDLLGFSPWESHVPGTPGQIDVLRALMAGHKSIAVRSGHKVGKSTVAAGIALWWFCTRPFARAVLTAPSNRQVKIILWREVRRLLRICRSRALARGVEFSDDCPKDPSTGIQTDDGRELIGFSTDDPDRFSGISSPNVIYIVDEAPGVAEPIYDALEGNRAGGATLLLTGNPTRTSGKFYDAFHRERSVFHCLHISSRNTPQGKTAIPGLATAEWCEERRRVWGEDSSLYSVRVLGDFPKQASNAIISLALLEQSLSLWEGTEYEGPLSIGVDPARFGDDDCVIQPVRGLKTYKPVILRSMDTIEIANAVIDAVLDLRKGPDELPVVNVDTIGVGAGVYDQLVRKDDLLHAFACDNSRRADSADYTNLRAQLHFNLRAWMEEGGAIHPDALLEGEIVAPVYTYDVRNRYQVESKDAIKERLHRSPDRADALMLAVYRPTRDTDTRVYGCPGRYSAAYN